MCGIVGVIVKGTSGLMNKHENCFFEMLYADALRGFDSTGVIAVDNTGAFSIMKEATEAGWFVPQLKDSALRKNMYARGKVYIGHNRKKTIGEITDEQAHPFVIDNTFAFVHNGTLHGHKLLADTTTDSQALAVVLKKSLEEDKYKDALEETLSKVWGAYATVMYNQLTDKVHFLRNKERPLFLIDAPDAVYFASEGMMATWILCRNEYKYSDLKVTFLDEYSFATYDLEKNTLIYETLEPKKATSHTQTSKSGGNGSVGSVAGNNILKATLSTKSQFKQFKRTWLGKRVRLWAEDGLEKNFPRTMDRDGETEFHLWGKLDDCHVLHDCTFDVDLSNHGITTEEEIYEQPWTGLVDAVYWSEQTKGAVITLTDAKPVVKAIQPTPHKNASTTTREVLQKRLEGMSWAALDREFREHQHQLMKWEKDCYDIEMVKKAKAVENILQQYHKLGYDACFEEAEKEGVVLTEVINNGYGKRQLIHPTKGVVYESTSSVTVH